MIKISQILSLCAVLHLSTSYGDVHATKNVIPSHDTLNGLLISLAQKTPLFTVDGVATLDAEVNVVGLGADSPDNSTHDICFIINSGHERCESNNFLAHQQHNHAHGVDDKTTMITTTITFSGSGGSDRRNSSTSKQVSFPVAYDELISSDNLFITARIADINTRAVLSSSRPTMMQRNSLDDAESFAITFVLTLTLSDFERATILFASLRKFLSQEAMGGRKPFVEEILVIVPDGEVVFFEVSGNVAQLRKSKTDDDRCLLNIKLCAPSQLYHKRSRLQISPSKSFPRPHSSPPTLLINPGTTTLSKCRSSSWYQASLKRSTI